MAIPVHTVDQMSGSAFARTDKVIMGLFSVPYVAGSGAGASVTSQMPLSVETPATAACFASAPAGAAVTAAIVNGVLNVTLTPLSNSATLAAGQVGVLVVA